MNKKIAILTLLLIIVPTVALAQSAPSLWPTGYWGPLVSCQGNPVVINGTTNQNGNACKSLCDLIYTIINIIYFAISVCFFIVAPILFIIGGIMIMVAGANPEMLSKGKSVLKSTVIGVLIVLCSYLIVASFIAAFSGTALGNYIQGFGGGGLSCSAPASNSSSGSNVGTSVGSGNLGSSGTSGSSGNSGSTGNAGTAGNSGGSGLVQSPGTGGDFGSY
jgi:hypothetical protein